MTAAGMPTPGRLDRLSPLVRRITQNNPSVFTGAGTNTYLIGRREIFVLDPGPENDEHFQHIVDGVGDSRVLAIIPTHHHRDHWPLAPRLADRFGAPTLGFAPYGDWMPRRTLADGEVVESCEAHLEAIHTPGHARDHLCFLLHEEETLFSGDHVMGWSTSVIAPPDGDLEQFMRSLDKLRGFSYRRMLPAHGLPIEEPYERIEELRAHREMRTRQILEALATGLERVPDLVDRIYAGIDPRLRTPAAWSLLAHLFALVDEGRVRMTGEDDPLEARYRSSRES